MHCMIGAPISANAMYTPLGPGKMAKSRKYRAWIDKNVPLLREGLSPAERFPVCIEILIMGTYEWAHKHDPDNCVKPIVDALVRAGILPDDTSRFVESVHCRHLHMTGYGTDAITRISYEEPAEVIEESAAHGFDGGAPRA